MFHIRGGGEKTLGRFCRIMMGWKKKRKKTASVVQFMKVLDGKMLHSVSHAESQYSVVTRFVAQPTIQPPKAEELVKVLKLK